MSDRGDLSLAIVDGDPAELNSARRLRRHALLTSMLLETGIVLCLLLWPLVKTAQLPLERLPVPVPVLYRASPSDAPRENSAAHPTPKSTTILHDQTVLQPPRVPPRIDANTDKEPPDLFDLSMPTAHDGLSAGIGEATQSLPSVVRPEAKPRPSGPISMSTGVMAARLIHQVQPSYPAAASLIHLEGTVELRAIIAKDGSIRNLEVVRGNPILAAAAIEAVREWRYRPTRLSGIPVEVETVITVQFQMR